VSDQTESTSDISKLEEFIKDIPFAMLTTVESTGLLRSRPMTVQSADFDGDLWFFTAEHSSKVDDVRRYPNVNLSFAKDQKFVSVSGRAEIVADPMKRAELWSPGYKAWFPKGLEDPELTLMKVTVERAEVWESPGNLLVQLLNFAKTIGGGRPKPSDLGEHKKLH
jgi:general stress protein 26